MTRRRAIATAVIFAGVGWLAGAQVGEVIVGDAPEVPLTPRAVEVTNGASGRTQVEAARRPRKFRPDGLFGPDVLEAHPAREDLRERWLSSYEAVARDEFELDLLMAADADTQAELDRIVDELTVENAADAWEESLRVIDDGLAAEVELLGADRAAELGELRSR